MEKVATPIKKITTATAYGVTKWDDVATIVSSWAMLKDEIEDAVSEGYDKQFNLKPESSDGAMFTAYRRIRDKMNELEGGEKDAGR